MMIIIINTNAQKDKEKRKENLIKDRQRIKLEESLKGK